MANDNGLKVDSTEGRPSVIVFETMSGVLFHITPLSLATVRAIQLMAQDQFPYPDKDSFRVLDPPEVSFSDGQTSRAEDNPAYVTATKEIDRERAQWVDKSVFEYAAKMPKYPTHEALVEAYKSQLTDLRKIAKFDKDDTDYDIVLLSFVLTGIEDGISDYVRIIRLAVQAVALSPSEVTAGVRFFRPSVSRTSS